MKRDEWMLLTLTFLTGLAIGMYVYIMFFKPTYTPENLNDSEAEASEWSLVAKRYSLDADRSVEPSFRLLGDRSYIYLPVDAGEPREGRISSGLMRELREFDDELYGYGAEPVQPECPSAQGGYDFEYRFIVDNTVYSLDTCTTYLGHNTSLSVLLKEVWDEIEGRRENNLRYGGFSKWAEEWINENIGVE